MLCGFQALAELQMFYLLTSEYVIAYACMCLGFSVFLLYLILMCADMCDKMVEALCSRHKNHIMNHPSRSTKDTYLHGNGKASDELDLRIASVLNSTGHHYEGGFWSDLTKHESADKKRHVAIVTTACLPWMTGTAVNPLFRAAYLAKSEKQAVTLVVPWLCKSDQELVYPNNLSFSSPKAQEAYIRNWLEERVGLRQNLTYLFVQERYLHVAICPN